MWAVVIMISYARIDIIPPRAALISLPDIHDFGFKSLDKLDFGVSTPISEMAARSKIVANWTVSIFFRSYSSCIHDLGVKSLDKFDLGISTLTFKMASRPKIAAKLIHVTGETSEFANSNYV